MKLTILGCGTSTGVPMVGCACPVCRSENPRDKRTRTSVLLETGGHYILIDTSTDLHKQAIRERIPHIDAVLFTHSHADHIHGIDDLRGFHFIHKRLIPCFGSPETMEVITANFSYIFNGLTDSGYAPLLKQHMVNGPFSLFGTTFTPIPMVHGQMTSTGYRFGNTAYLTDCSDIPDDSMALLGGLDVLIIDALRYTPHSNHFNIDGALAIVRQLGPKRTIFTHLTHEVPYSDNERMPEGVELAYDGMIVRC